MTESYIVSKSGSYNLTQLQEEVEDSSIGPSIEFCVSQGEDITLTFASALTSPEETLLDTLVLNHTPDVSLGSIVQLLNFGMGELIPKDNWVKLGSTTFLGTRKASPLQNIEVTGYMSGSITDYSIRVIDTSNANVVASATFTNTTSETNVLGTISNLSKTRQHFDILYKTSGGSSGDHLYITDMVLYA